MDDGSIPRAICQRRPLRSVDDMLILAIVLITGALVAYTAGVWAEHRAGTLRAGHVALFATGLVLDASGTGVMGVIARSGGAKAGVAGVLSQVMQVTGAIALVLMAAHLAWAVWTWRRGSARERLRFHRFSTLVWALWLVPYFTGMASSMA
ncbi:HsmA family protein [Nigerium massiliense]|uniref:HsmA family protein n=1 Tax=Nigerium massiliense TaxID=1522317 RepID=UPI000907B720|nr:HsmA family protein [Nigerium massiliense]